MNWIPIVIIAMFVGIIIWIIRHGVKNAQKAKYENDMIYINELQQKYLKHLNK